MTMLLSILDIYVGVVVRGLGTELTPEKKKIQLELVLGSPFSTLFILWPHTVSLVF